jgi:hypothetical protein
MSDLRLSAVTVKVNSRTGVVPSLCEREVPTYA